MNWSVLAIFVLVTWELADLILPNYHPDQASAIYWTLGIVTALLFFVSLLVHELSHALVARRNGIAVRRITFWLFGGVSELEKDALTPGADFQIAVVGPLSSFALAVLFSLLGLGLRGLNGGVEASAAGWLAWMNLLLGAFNLVPAAPLDGGRVLRSILWHRSGDRASAAAAAARAGQVFAYVLIVFGIIEFLAVGVFGLWFLFLGWFLLTAAHAEENFVIMRSSLANVLVRDVMTRDPITFSSLTTVADLIDNQIHNFRFGSFPLIASNGRLEGLTTMGKIRQVPPSQRSNTRLIDTASSLADVPTTAPGAPLTDLLQRMQASPDGRAFVLDEVGRLVGIVSPSDIARLVQLAMLQSHGRSH